MADIIDSSGNGYDGQTSGLVRRLYRNSISSAIQLYGDGHINFENPTGAFDFSDSDDWSIGCWFKTSNSDRMEIIQKGDTSIPIYHLYIENGILAYEAGSTSLVLNNIRSNDSFWHLVIVTNDRTSDIARLYYDGVEIKTANILPNASYVDPGSSLIAGMLFGGSNHFIGGIDNMFIQGRVTTVSEVLDMFNNAVGRSIEAI